MRLAPNVHIQVTHFTDEGQRIVVPWVQADYKNTNKGLEKTGGGYWQPLLVLDEHDPSQTRPCRMPARLVSGRTQEDKARQSVERREQDMAAIAEIKRQQSAGMHITVEG